MNAAKEEILSRVRMANGGPTSIAEAADAWTKITRGYAMSAGASQEDVLQLFAERLRDYDATVVGCDLDRLTEMLIDSLRNSEVRRLAVASGFDLVNTDALARSGIETLTGDEMTPRELDRADGVLTACSLAIAETGTLILQNVPGQGTRALTLVPDVHFCVVRAADVVAEVPEAIAKLQPTATLPTTFVSGPSATADIEMTRIKGVHGPRFLHVFVVT